ncbi:MAG: trehalose-phosphatase [Caulobacterales bacterium]|nr:trehalose-phosphatase [Caulobacterales bacterium]
MSDDRHVLGRLSPRDALFLDFDGTLAELGPDPDAVTLPDATLTALQQVFDRLGGAMAVISGRDIRDLALRTPRGLWRVGGHGLDRVAPGEDPPAEAPSAPPVLTAALEAIAAGNEGVRLERKGRVLTLHYRAAPQCEEACLAAVLQAVAREDGYVSERGKMVVEAKPVEAEKGAALTRLMGEPPFAGRRPLMIGDDVTDESAFAAALALGGRAVKVGRGASCARERVESPQTVRAWLEEEAGR